MTVAFFKKATTLLVRESCTFKLEASFAHLVYGEKYESGVDSERY